MLKDTKVIQLGIDEDAERLLSIGGVLENIWRMARIKILSNSPKHDSGLGTQNIGNIMDKLLKKGVSTLS